MELQYRKFFTIVITIPMMFGGGMVATYMIIARLLHLTNTLWALILPMAMNSFNIIVLRTFFNTSIPDAVVESAKIDGASEWRLFFQIVIPMSVMKSRPPDFSLAHEVAPGGRQTGGVLFVSHIAHPQKRL